MTNADINFKKSVNGTALSWADGSVAKGEFQFKLKQNLCWHFCQFLSSWITGNENKFHHFVQKDWKIDPSYNSTLGFMMQVIESYLSNTYRVDICLFYISNRNGNEKKSMKGISFHDANFFYEKNFIERKW